MGEPLWQSVIWTPKYEKKFPSEGLWGSAVIAQNLKLERYEPDETFPWLRELRGSTAIAKSKGSPRWFASVHVTPRPIPDDLRSSMWPKDLPVSTRNNTTWGTDVIPYELNKLFAGTSFVWGGDLNSAESMDDKPSFAGGNRLVRKVWEEGGSYDLRKAIHAEEQRTYFVEGRGPYQLDHVFGDKRTLKRVKSWKVNPRPATAIQPYSDHAPILVEIGD